MCMGNDPIGIENAWKVNGRALDKASRYAFGEGTWWTKNVLGDQSSESERTSNAQLAQQTSDAWIYLYKKGYAIDDLQKMNMYELMQKHKDEMQSQDNRIKGVESKTSESDQNKVASDDNNRQLRAASGAEMGIEDNSSIYKYKLNYLDKLHRTSLLGEPSEEDKKTKRKYLGG